MLDTILRRLHLVVSIALLAAVAAPARAGAPAPLPAGASYRDDAVIVQLAPEAAVAARSLAVPGARRGSLGVAGADAAATALGGATFEPEFREAFATTPAAAPLRATAATDALAAFYVVHLPPGTTREQALAALRGAPGVASADPIALCPVSAVPNDSLWSAAWQLYQPSRHDIHAPEAWSVTKGDSSAVVAIIDTGVLLHHPDLHDHLWTNMAEANGLPGVDDDGNGYVDDLHGWDFVALDSAAQVVPGEDWRDEDADPDDFVGHGTAVAGVAAGITDNTIGVASIGWNVHLMALRAGYASSQQPAGLVDMSYAARALVYAAHNGATIANCSFLTVAENDLDAALAEADRWHVVLVVAGGNSGYTGYLPMRDDVISVAATDANDKVPAFSTPSTYVTLAAPGVSLPSTLLDRPGQDSLGMRHPAYTTGASGTSFSSPLVAGAIGLLQSDRRARGLPPMPPMMVAQRLVETVDDISAANPGTSGYGAGRLNAYRLLADSTGSFAVAFGAAIVGPGVLLPTSTPPARMAFVTADARLLIPDAADDGVLRSTSLPAAPVGGIAAARRANKVDVLFVALANGQVVGYDAGGNPLPGWPQAAPGWVAGPGHEPALGDLDGDGDPEVVWGGADGRVYAWHANGAAVAGFPHAVAGAHAGVQVALAALDAQSGLEIVAASDDGVFTVLGGDGQVRPGWPRALGGGLRRPIVVKQGNPAKPVLVTATGAVVGAFDATGVSLWQHALPGPVMLPLAAADVDGDGSEEVVAVSASPPQVDAIDAGGWSRDTWAVNSGVLTSAQGAPVIGSVLPGGGLGIAFMTATNSLTAFAPGGTQYALPHRGGAGLSPTLVTLNGSGRTSILAGTASDSVSLFVYALGAGTWNAAHSPWPTLAANAARTGCSFGATALGNVDGVPGRPLAAPAALVVRSSPARPPIELDWRAAGASTAPARLELFDASGRRVRAWTLAGLSGAVSWDGRDGAGSRVPPGLYFVRMADGPSVLHARVVLVR